MDMEWSYQILFSIDEQISGLEGRRSCVPYPCPSGGAIRIASQDMAFAEYAHEGCLGVRQLALPLTRIFLFVNICLRLWHHRHYAKENTSAESAVQHSPGWSEAEPWDPMPTAISPERATQAASPFQGSFSCFSLPRASPSIKTMRL
jgi:hypothetical protein